MKKGRRLIAIAAALLLSLSLSACGGGAQKAAETEKAVETAAETTVETAAETESPAETEAVETEKAAETEAAETDSIDDRFEIGTSDGAVYQNDFFNLRIDAAGNGLLLADEDQRVQLSAIVADTVNNDSIKEALDGGQTYMDLYAYTPDLGKTLNMNIQNMGPVFGLLGDMDTILDMIMPELQGQLEGMGLQNIMIEKTTCTFRGEEVSCIVISGEINGLNLCEKQVYIKEGSYMAVLTAAGPTEEDGQALLDLVTAVN